MPKESDMTEYECAHTHAHTHANKGIMKEGVL